ncbi:penicillin-binding protein [Candidatus Roizmanbacteria bacterium]|nr:penicillin-binding protein [Candidatus Roizmanbacteria bacterium]
MTFFKKLVRLPKKLFHKKLLVITPALLLVVGGALAVAVYFFIFYNLPSPAKLKGYKAVPLSTHIYDRNGKLLYEVYRDENRTPIYLKDIPAYVAKASVAIEDKDFYKHKGVSVISGVLRAAKETLFKRNVQGGSTITQQLVKTALLSPERTIQRKMREMVLALWVEQMYSKDQILEFYLNQVPYGGSSYGIEEAAKNYFGKHAQELTLSEAALLAGLPQAPSLYSPQVNPEYAIKRRDEVLQKMYEQKYITQDQKKAAQSETPKILPPSTPIKAPHFVFYVKSKLEEAYGADQVEEGGLKVTTTLDLDVQEQAEKTLKDELEKVKNLHVSNGGVLVTRPSTGEILTMVGSVDYFATASGAFNVTTALRQPGSSIKPLNYAVGIDRKLVTPASVFLDTKTCFPGGTKQYCPVNYDGLFHGAVQLRFALGNSFNIPAVKMLAINGVDTFIASASAFGINTFGDSRDYGLALTLGGGEVRMTEMAQAFSAFPNRGKVKDLVSILKIEDKSGKVLYQFKDPNYVQNIKQSLPNPNFLAIQGKQVLSPETTFLISHILLDNNARMAAFGPSSYLVVPKHAVSVKTGTTDDKKDNWTIGYTPNFLTAVWVGNNDGTPMNPYLTSGITGAAPIWNKVMIDLLKNQPDLWPIKPENVVGYQVCITTGEIMNKGADGKENCPSRFEYMIKGTESIGHLPVTKEKVKINKDNGKLATSTDTNVEEQEKTIMKDAYSTYCVDCTPDNPQPTPTP